MALTIDKKDKRKITTWVPYKHQREICISLARTGIQPTFKGRWSTSTWLWGYEALSLAPKSGIPKPRQVAVDPTWDDEQWLWGASQDPSRRSLRSWKVNCWSNLYLGTRVGTWKSMKNVCSCFSFCSCYNVDGVYMGILYLMKCILYTWGWLMPRVGRKFAVPLWCFHVVFVCSSIPRMSRTSCCHNYEIMCKSYKGVAKMMIVRNQPRQAWRSTGALLQTSQDTLGMLCWGRHLCGKTILIDCFLRFKSVLLAIYS